MAPSKSNGNGNGHANGSDRDDTLIDCRIKDLHYGAFRAVRDVALTIKRGTITAFIAAQVL